MGVEGGGGASGERLVEPGSHTQAQGCGSKSPNRRREGLGVSRGGRHPEGPREVFCVLNTTKAPRRLLGASHPWLQASLAMPQGPLRCLLTSGPPLHLGSTHGSRPLGVCHSGLPAPPGPTEPLVSLFPPTSRSGKTLPRRGPSASSTRKRSTPLSTLSLPCEQNNHLQLN